MQRTSNSSARKASFESSSANSRGNAASSASPPFNRSSNSGFASSSKSSWFNSSSKSSRQAYNSFICGVGSVSATSLSLNHSAEDVLGRNPGFVSRCWSSQSLYYWLDMPNGPPKQGINQNKLIF
jgi:hypothetical protein